MSHYLLLHKSIQIETISTAKNCYKKFNTKLINNTNPLVLT
jgi:hypothetical protein